MNMACANKACNAELKYLRDGRLFLMEREPKITQQSTSDRGMLKHAATMRRYFWLCESCAQTYVIRRWTESDIELDECVPKRLGPKPTATSDRWMMPGLVG